jgi:hypothetical protein
MHICYSYVWSDESTCSVLSYAVHSYFRRKVCICEYANYHGSDAEGAGEMFKVTALPFDGTPRTEDGKELKKISLEKKPT